MYPVWVVTSSTNNSHTAPHSRDPTLGLGNPVSVCVLMVSDVFEAATDLPPHDRASTFDTMLCVSHDGSATHRHRQPRHWLVSCSSPLRGVAECLAQHLLATPNVTFPCPSSHILEALTYGSISGSQEWRTYNRPGILAHVVVAASPTPQLAPPFVASFAFAAIPHRAWPMECRAQTLASPLLGFSEVVAQHPIALPGSSLTAHQCAPLSKRSAAEWVWDLYWLPPKWS